MSQPLSPQKQRVQNTLDKGSIIAPSILSADFTKLGDEVRAVEQAGADWIHVDIMDGHFVPNITFGPSIVKALRTVTQLPLDVHLMITEPERYIESFANAGADIITVHAEATVHLHRTLQLIHAQGCLAGVSLNPHSPEETLRYLLSSCDLILVMSVNPGFGGQLFLSEILPKLESLQNQITKNQLDTILEIDGGISRETAQSAALAGARAFVAGNAIFNSTNYTEAIRHIRSATTSYSTYI